MTSDTLFIIVLAIIAVSTVYGTWNGLIKTLMPVVTIILTLWMVSIIMPYFSSFLRTDIRKLAFLEAFCDILAFAVTFFIMRLIMKLFLKIFSMFSDVPVISGIDRILGTIVGFFGGMLIIWVIFYFVLLMIGRENGAGFFAMIDSNFFLKFLYNHNLLMTFVNSVAFT